MNSTRKVNNAHASAFPVAESGPNSQTANEVLVAEYGLTKLEYFAAKAFAAMLGNPINYNLGWDSVAKNALVAAEIMVETLGGAA